MTDLCNLSCVSKVMLQLNNGDEEIIVLTLFVTHGEANTQMKTALL